MSGNELSGISENGRPKTAEVVRSTGEMNTGASSFTRKNFLKVSGMGVAAASLLGVAGCGGGGGSGGDSGDGGGGAGSQDRGNNLVIGWDQEPAILNPVIVGGDLVATQVTTSVVQDSVLQIQPDLSYAPNLSDGMPEVVSEDPFTIEVTLQDGLVWSDGEPLTSADLQFTYETIMNEDNQIITREIWDKIETFETPDELTARIVFSEPDARWMDIFADNQPVLPQHILEGENFNEFFNSNVVGSGPYTFDEWNRGQSMRFVRNENYWGDEPAFESITFRFITDTNTLVTALSSGEVDFINPAPDIGLIARLEEQQGTTVNIAYGAEWEHIDFNTEVIDNVDLRRGIAYAINRQQVLDDILPGNARRLDSVIVPELSDYYTPAWEQYSYDPDRARELIEGAIADGAPETIVFSTTSGNALRENLQQIVQQQLADVGLTIEIQNEAAQQFFGDSLPGGNFEMGEWAWSATPDPSITTLFSGTQVAPDGQNYPRYSNDEVTDLLERSDSAIDVAERGDLLKQAQELIAEDVPIIPFYQRPSIYAFREDLQGPENNPSLATPTWNIQEWSFG